MTARPEVYFGASDRQMEAFLDLATFREALVYNILFQGDLVVIDIFFYISTHLKQMLLKNRYARNFIATAVRDGAIVPAFRSENTFSFRQNLDEIKTSGIQGMHDRAEEIAAVLDDALTGRRLYSKTWPKEPVSVGYRKTLEHALLSDDILDRFPRLERIWNATRDAREYLISAAKYDSFGGIRRGDMYNLLNTHFNREHKVVDDVRSIWASIAKRQVSHDAQTLLKWINYCYYHNQGRMIGLNPGFSALNQLDIQFTRHLTALSDGTERIDPITAEFRLPSARALLTIDPPYLLDVRDSVVGERYFSCISAWRQDPTDATSREVTDALGDYIAAINRVYLARGKSLFNWEWHLKAHVPPGRGVWGELNSEALRVIAMDTLAEIIPHIHLTSIVGTVAATMYETMPARWRDKIGPPIGIPARPKLEIERTAQRFRVRDYGTIEASFTKG